MFTRTYKRLRPVALLIACALMSLAPMPAAGHAAAPAAHSGQAPAAYPHPPDLSDVACPSARVCYAVGFYGVQYHGTVFATTNGGRSWHEQHPGTNWGLRGITCVSTTMCYAVGYAETTVVTTNGGRSWHDPHVPRSHQALFRIACPTHLTCIATGNSPNGYIALVHRILLTTDGGRSWSYPSTPIDRTAYPMNGVACPSARVCYVVGGYATILVTHDAGRTWQWQRNPLMNNSGIVPPLAAVACTSTSTCIAVGGIGGGAILRTGDGGRDWTSQANPAGFALTGVACPTSRVCYAVGYNGTALLSRDGGRTWTLLDSGTSAYFSSIACHGPSFCVVVGYAGYVAVLSHLAQGRRAATPTPVPGRPTAQATTPPAPTQVAAATSTPAGSSCHSWDVSGTWQYQSMTMGNGQATLQQSGTALSGSLAAGGVTWTLQGSIQGASVTMTMSAPGQVDQSFQGTVSADGTTIVGNVGTFSGGHARCTG